MKKPERFDPKISELGIIRTAVSKAEEYGMEVEFIHSCVDIARANPQLTVEEVVKLAMLEWDLV